MKTIRILQVFTIMNRGGAESMIMNYYRNIDRNKIQFDFLVHRPEKGAFDDEIIDLGGKIFEMPAINPFNPTGYYIKLRSFFEKHHHYKIIHSHINTFSCFPLKIAREFNLPVRIAHAHIAIDRVNINSFFNSKENISETLKKIVKFQLKKRVKTDATHLFSCGKKAGEWLFGKNESFQLMNNAIDSKKFQYNKSIEKEYRKKFDLEDNLVIGHVGRFNSQKNHDFLISIFQTLLKKKENCKLVLIGDGDLRKGIENQVHKLKLDNDVKFLGIRNDIAKLLQMIDVFVFPSHYEGLPVTLIEAQAAGLKIIASDTITTEVKLTNDIRFLSLKNSNEIWAEEIIKLSNFKKKNNNQSIVSGNYDIISNAGIIEKFYLENNSC